jgi:heme-degrading monooxygenase HmoA
MFCSVASLKASPQNLDKIVKHFQDHGIPMVSSQEGFKSVYLAAKPSGEFMIINIWDTEEHANAWRNNPEHHEMAKPLDALTIGEPVFDAYELRAHAT